MDGLLSLTGRSWVKMEGHLSGMKKWTTQKYPTERSMSKVRIKSESRALSCRVDTFACRVPKKRKELFGAGSYLPHISYSSITSTRILKIFHNRIIFTKYNPFSNYIDARYPCYGLKLEKSKRIVDFRRTERENIKKK